MRCAVFLFAFLLAAVTAPGARALETRVHGIKLDGAVSWVGMIQGTATIRTADGRYHKVGLDGHGITLTPRPAPLGLISSGDDARMPDEVLVTGARNIRQAWYRLPTDRYDHGVLGDAVEAGGLGLRMDDDRVETLSLSKDAVFEDRVPRIVDIDGDGVDEVVAVKSYLSAGAALAVIETSDRGLRLAAESEPIGTTYRWLNPVGVGDFDNDGRNEIAAVITPHLGVILRLFEWRDDKLVEDGEQWGFSNHASGSPEQGLGAIADVNGDGVVDLIVPDGSRVDLRVVTFKGGKFKELAKIANADSIGLAVIAQDLNGDGRAEVVMAPGGTLKVVEFLP